MQFELWGANFEDDEDQNNKDTYPSLLNVHRALKHHSIQRSEEEWRDPKSSELVGTGKEQPGSSCLTEEAAAEAKNARVS